MTSDSDSDVARRNFLICCVLKGVTDKRKREKMQGKNVKKTNEISGKERKCQRGHSLSSATWFSWRMRNGCGAKKKWIIHSSFLQILWLAGSIILLIESQLNKLVNEQMWLFEILLSFSLSSPRSFLPLKARIVEDAKEEGKCWNECDALCSSTFDSLKQILFGENAFWNIFLKFILKF